MEKQPIYFRTFGSGRSLSSYARDTGPAGMKTERHRNVANRIAEKNVLRGELW